MLAQEAAIGAQRNGRNWPGAACLLLGSRGEKRASSAVSLIVAYALPQVGLHNYTDTCIKSAWFK